MAGKPSVAELQGYPKMAHWFNPVLLIKLLLRVIISAWFGQYADRRLIEAALDAAPDPDLVQRADIRDVLAVDSEGAVWVDFVADLGDGFDATYAIAYLLAQEAIHVNGKTLPRAGAVFMGGDEVYPTASRDDYKIKTINPYSFAFPNQPSPQHPLIMPIPGNHDWYDGLETFLAYFARSKPTTIGNWRTRQRRSYFAARVSDLCWVWAIDVALVENMDQPQADYFVAIAKAMPQGANIILCSAEPGWYKAEKESESYRTLSYAAWIAENAGKALRIPLVLSGDSHHYARYASEEGVQYITSGGGGAFLHGTHQLPETIHANWLKTPHSVLSLKTTSGGTDGSTAKEACWPTKEESRRLLNGNLFFAFTNWDFAIALGFIYSLLVFWISETSRVDVAVIALLILTAGFVGYSGYQEDWRPKAVAVGAVEAALHWGAVLALTAAALAADPFALAKGPWWIWLLVLVVCIVPLGGLVGGTIFGLKLLISSRWLDLNHNDAFSSMRLFDYRHFLRIRIIGDHITVYPIGLPRVPRRNEWIENPNPDGPPGSYFVPSSAMEVGLIEDPIEISGHGIPPTTTVKKPSELPS